MFTKSNVSLGCLACASLLISLGAGQAAAQSHAWVDQSRSSLQRNVFVSQAIEGEYGRIEKDFSDSADQSASAHQTWRGYGIQNGVGIELFKFTQFSLSHTMLSLRSKESSLENMNGSRLGAGITFVFSAPIGNMEFGAGANASQMSYQHLEKSASFLGAGHYYSIGMNYFLTPNISVFSTGRRSKMNYKHSGGQAAIEAMKSNSDSLGFGAKIWF